MKVIEASGPVTMLLADVAQVRFSNSFHVAIDHDLPDGVIEFRNDRGEVVGRIVNINMKAG